MYKYLTVIFSLLVVVGCASQGTPDTNADQAGATPTDISDSTDWNNNNNNFDDNLDVNDDNTDKLDVDETGTAAVEIITAAEDFGGNVTRSARFEENLEAKGGSGRYVWTVSGLPTGLSVVNARLKKITVSGRASVLGSFTANAQVCDANDLENCAAKTYSILVRDIMVQYEQRNFDHFITVPPAGEPDDVLEPMPSDQCGSPLHIEQVTDERPLGHGVERAVPHSSISFQFQVTGGVGPYEWSLNGMNIDEINDDTRYVGFSESSGESSCPECDFDWQISNEGEDTSIFNVSTLFDKPTQIICWEDGNSKFLDYPSAPCSGQRQYITWMDIEVRDTTCTDLRPATKGYTFDVTPRASQGLNSLKVKAKVYGNDTGEGNGCGAGFFCTALAAVRFDFINKADKRMAWTDYNGVREDSWVEDSWPEDRGTYQINVSVEEGFQNVEATEIKRAKLVAKDNSGCLYYFDFQIDWLIIYNDFWYLYWNANGNKGEDVDVGDDYAELNVFVKSDFDILPENNTNGQRVEWRKCSEIGSDPNRSELQSHHVCE